MMNSALKMMNYEGGLLTNACGCRSRITSGGLGGAPGTPRRCFRSTGLPTGRS